MIKKQKMFSVLFITVRRSNNSSSSSLFSMNNFKFLYTRDSTLTLLVYLNMKLFEKKETIIFGFYLMLSLPRKSNSTIFSPIPSILSYNLTCSTRNEQQPTVSASSSSFSLPTRRASLKEMIKKNMEVFVF